MNSYFFLNFLVPKKKLHREYLLTDIDPIGVSWQMLIRVSSIDVTNKVMLLNSY